MSTIAQAFKHPAPVSVHMENDATDVFVRAYRWHRRAGVGDTYPAPGRDPHMNPAAEAIDRARMDATAQRVRWPSSLDTGYNPRFSAYGESHLRWIEHPGAAGLRFVGYADALAGMRHTGYFVDDMQMETVRGVVYQLPSRRGRIVYAYGYADPFNNGPVCLCFADDAQDEHDAAIWADGIAERMAEEAWEHDAASRAGIEYVEAGERLQEIRRDVLDVCRELKEYGGAAELRRRYPATFGTLSYDIEGKMKERAELFAKRADLLDRWGDQPGFRDV